MRLRSSLCRYFLSMRTPWRTTPSWVVQALVVIPFAARLVGERGSSLVGIMIHGESLLHRAVQAVPGAEWLDGLRTRVEAVAQLPPAPERMQPALFDQYTKVLEGLAAAHPLLLVVDDMQWADRGSIALLWHLARRLEGLRLLVVGIYRPEEITGTDYFPGIIVKWRGRLASDGNSYTASGSTGCSVYAWRVG